MWKSLPSTDPRREGLGKLIRDLSMTKHALSRIRDPEQNLRTLEERLSAIDR